MKYRLMGSFLLGAAWLTGAACEGPPRLPPCGATASYADGQCWERYELRVNSVFYLADREKRAVSPRDGKFEVRDSRDRAVFKGRTSQAQVAPDTQETLYVIDFSSYREPGEYYIALDDGARSPQFSIGPEPAEQAFRNVMLGLFGQRCGQKVKLTSRNGSGPKTSWQHDTCHEDEAHLDLVGSGTADDRGGWHDAGDYGKYTVNGAFAVAFLLKAYEHYSAALDTVRLDLPTNEVGGRLPDILDEAKVELDWILKVQLKDGSFAHKVTAKQFEGTLMPENDRSERYFSPVGTAATGDAVGALALAARLYAKFDAEFAETCLEAALRGHQFLSGHKSLIQPDLSEFSTGAYLAQDGDQDERQWASIELFETTGQPTYLKEFEKNLKSPTIQAYFDWYGAGNLALDTYLRGRQGGRSDAQLTAVASAFTSAADQVAARSAADPYGRGSATYSWGSNGATARLALTLATAHFVDPDPNYLNAIQAQVDYLYGRNPFGRSFVTGIGHYPPTFPHHRPSGADQVEAPWPGLLVGGPHSGGSNPPVSIAALKWQDASDDYNHNEIAINWNTALAYALAALLGSETPGECASLGAGGSCSGQGDALGGGGHGGAGGAH